MSWTTTTPRTLWLCKGPNTSVLMTALRRTMCSWPIKKRQWIKIRRMTWILTSASFQSGRSREITKGSSTVRQNFTARWTILNQKVKNSRFVTNSMNSLTITSTSSWRARSWCLLSRRNKKSREASNSFSNNRKDILKSTWSSKFFSTGRKTWSLTVGTI